MPYEYSQETMDRLLDLGDEAQGRLPRSFIKKYGQPVEPAPAQDWQERHEPNALRPGRDDTLPLLGNGRAGPGSLAPPTPRSLLDETAEKMPQAWFGGTGSSQHSVRVAGRDLLVPFGTEDHDSSEYISSRKERENEEVRRKQRVPPTVNDKAEPSYSKQSGSPRGIERSSDEIDAIFESRNTVKHSNVLLRSDTPYDDMLIESLGTELTDYLPSEPEARKRALSDITFYIKEAVKKRNGSSQPGQNDRGKPIGVRIGIDDGKIIAHIPNSQIPYGASRGYMDSDDPVLNEELLLTVIVVPKPITAHVRIPAQEYMERHLSDHRRTYLGIVIEYGRPVLVVTDELTYHAFLPK